jgi:tetrapyrrole methylase family protein / MazG family protein
MPQAPDNLREFSSLLSVVETLRGPHGCPWDKEQTHQTLTRFALEETAELIEAMDAGDLPGMREELGDVLLQVLLNTEIARQMGEFNIEDVIEGIAQKLVRRHPHVFANVKVKDSDEVLKNWHEIKKEEKSSRPLSGGLPTGLPALIASQKIGEKTKRHRFDWTVISQVVAKVDEELLELKDAMKQGTAPGVQQELGDLFFTLAQLARHLGLDAEQCARQANQRFETRFVKMQALCEAKGLDFSKATPADLEKFWTLAKTYEAKS